MSVNDLGLVQQRAALREITDVYLALMCQTLAERHVEVLLTWPKAKSTGRDVYRYHERNIHALVGNERSLARLVTFMVGNLSILSDMAAHHILANPIVQWVQTDPLFKDLVHSPITKDGKFDTGIIINSVPQYFVGQLQPLQQIA